MSRRWSQQAGFSTVLGIIGAVAVVGLVILMGWAVYSHSQTASTNTTTTTHSSPDTRKTDQYAGWQTYCSTAGGICLRYPADWQQHETSGPDPASDQVTFISPSQTVQVVYIPVLRGVG